MNVTGRHPPKKPVVGVSIATGDTVVLCGGLEIEAAGFDPGHVNRCCKGKRKKHGGFTWRYLHDYIISDNIHSVEQLN